MFLHEYLLRAASGLGKSQRKTAAHLGLTHATWHALIHGNMDPHLKTLVGIGKHLGFDVVLSAQGESVSLRIAPPKTTGVKAEIEVVPADVSAWRQTMDEMVAHLTPEQFAQVSRVLSEMVKTFVPKGADNREISGPGRRSDRKVTRKRSNR